MSLSNCIDLRAGWSSELVGLVWQGDAYLSVIDLLKAIARFLDRDDDGDTREMVRADATRGAARKERQGFRRRSLVMTQP